LKIKRIAQVFVHLPEHPGAFATSGCLQLWKTWKTQGFCLILKNSGGKTQGNLKYTLEIFENQMVCFGDAI